MRDCVVSPDVFNHMADSLGDFVVPYQQALETEAGKRNVPLYLAGLLSHLPRKNAEDIATLVDVVRLVMQDFLGTAPWDYRPLVQVLVGQVVDRLGEPDGVIAFDPSSFPKRGTHMTLALISVWFLIGETHRGQQVTPALTLPQIRYGLSVLLLEVFCTPGIDYICRQVHRQFMRNELARFYHHHTRKCLPPRKLRRDIQ